MKKEGTAAQDFMERLRELQQQCELADKSNQTCGHPGCKEPFQRPYRDIECICRQPMWIVIPPGGHIHIQCPRHGDVKIYGSGVTYSYTEHSTTY